MNTTRTPRLVAFALALMMTLTIFSGVTSLSAPDHAGQWLAQVNSHTEPPRG